MAFLQGMAPQQQAGTLSKYLQSSEASRSFSAEVTPLLCKLALKLHHQWCALPHAGNRRLERPMLLRQQFSCWQLQLAWPWLQSQSVLLNVCDMFAVGQRPFFQQERLAKYITCLTCWCCLLLAPRCAGPPPFRAGVTMLPGMESFDMLQTVCRAADATLQAACHQRPAYVHRGTHRFRQSSTSD